MIQLTQFVSDQAVRAKSFVTAGLRSTIGKNLLSLYVLQFANNILPLVTIPYLVRVLGPEPFGAVAFTQSLMAYLEIVIGFGFDYTATRRIAVHRDEPELLNRIVSSVWAAKALLCVICFALMVLLIWSVPKLREVSLLLFILYGNAVSNVLFPGWLYTGLERMVKISVICLSLRIIASLGIFVFIHRPEDYIIYAGLLSLQTVVSGIVGCCYAFKILKIRLVKPSIPEVRQVLSEGWAMFLSSAAMSFYTSGNAFILGITTNYLVVGYYSAAEKIVVAVLKLYVPIAQALYPRFSKLAADSKELTLFWARRMLIIMSSFGFTLSVILFVGAPFFVRLLLGPDYEASITVMRILSPLPFIISISHVFGVQVLLPLRHDKAILIFICLAGLLNVGLAFLLSPLWGAGGMALAVLISEAFITISYAAYSRSVGLTLSPGNIAAKSWAS